MQSAQRQDGFALRRESGNGTAQSVQRKRVSFEYASSQPAQSVLCDKLPHSAHRLGNAA